MEVYILDSLLRRTQVFDKFESLIWTERFNEIGDFELDLVSTMDNRTQFTAGTRLAINNSYRVMTVESTEDKTAADGKQVLKIKGHSLETLLQDRVVKEAFTASPTTDANWVLNDTPGNIARTMFDHICRDGALDPNDVIPFLMPGTIFAPGTIPETETEIVWEQPIDLLYNGIKGITDVYDFGFRLVRNFDMSQLYFDIYTGNDRTTRQTILPPVVFSTSLDNIQDTTEFSTIEKSKNVAYVFSPVGVKVVFGDNVDPDVEGFDRRVLFVNANDVTAETADIDGALEQKGFEALAKSRASSLFDGEINEHNEYKYGSDYDLGDLVELRNRDGVITYKRVTEQIFVSDHEGERSYPTLEMDLFAGANTWLSYTNKPTVWADYTTEFWEDM